MLDLTRLRILVTGGSGFLGRHVCRELLSQGCTDVCAPPSSEYDMRERHAAHKMHFDYTPDVVIHLAARCGGIGANMAAPAEFLLDNLLMGVNVVEAAVKNNVRKLVLVGTVCSYPAFNDGFIRSSDLWKGYPEPTNAPYGIAKRCVGEYLAAAHAQHGMPAAYVIPTNLYGPGDCFDDGRSHVIPAMIRRFHDAAEAGEHAVTCWGTGAPTRDFLHVSDAAEAIVLAASKIESPEPINLGTGAETSMRDLADSIAVIVGYRGRIKWDGSKPNGQLSRRIDTSEQCDKLGWMPRILLAHGLAGTVEWYRETLARA